MPTLKVDEPASCIGAGCGRTVVLRDYTERGGGITLENPDGTEHECPDLGVKTPAAFTVEMAVNSNTNNWWPLEAHHGEADHATRTSARRVMSAVSANLKPGFLVRVVDVTGAVVAGPVDSDPEED